MINKVHPFELADMGTGPYTFVGMFSIPSPSLAEANPEAYNTALRAMPKLSRGCGTCANCGMAIMNVCIVRSSEGTPYGVGTDCVEKTGDASLGTPVKVAVAKLRREQSRARREAKRAAALAKWRIDHADEIAAKEAAEQKATQDWAAARLARRESLADILAALDAQRTEFHESLGAQLVNGPLSERQALFVAKAMFGRATKANEADFSKVMDRCTTN